MKIWTRVISIILALSLTAMPLLGCGGKGTRYTVTPSQGANVTFESISIRFSPNAVDTDSPGSISVVRRPPRLVDGLNRQERRALSSVCKFVGDVYNVDIGSPLKEPAEVIIAYSPRDIPSGFSEDDLYLAHYVDGHWHLVPGTVDQSARTVTAHLSHFSPVTLIVAVGGLIGIGTVMVISSLLTQPAFSNTAHHYLTPKASNIQRAVNSGQFTVNPSGRELSVRNVNMQAESRSRLTRPKMGSEMLDNPRGMCEDFANLFGSLLIAAGYPVRLVGGNATYTLPGERVSGGHAWVEVLIDGKLYYVDTFDPRKVALIPIDEARRSLELKPGIMWGKTADGKPIRSRPYDEFWPLLGQWKLQRTSVSMDHSIPDMALNRIVPQKPTWELTRVGGHQLKWTYDGSDYWFKSLGQRVNLRPTSTIEESAEACTIHGGGNLHIASLPTVLNFVLRMGRGETKRIDDININYEDVVEMKIVDNATATITVTADIKGTYVSTREVRNPSTGVTERVQLERSFTEYAIIIYKAERQK